MRVTMAPMPPHKLDYQEKPPPADWSGLKKGAGTLALVIGIMITVIWI